MDAKEELITPPDVGVINYNSFRFADEYVNIISSLCVWTESSDPPHLSVKKCSLHKRVTCLIYKEIRNL